MHYVLTTESHSFTIISEGVHFEYVHNVSVVVSLVCFFGVTTKLEHSYLVAMSSALALYHFYVLRGYHGAY